MLPIYLLQKANLEDFKANCAKEVLRTFAEKPIKWCLEFKSRNNQKCVKKDFYDIVK